MRLAGLLSILEQRGDAVSRDGSGKLVEVYPAAALSVWGFDSRGYKRKENRDARRRLLAAIKARTESWLTLPDHIRRACEDSDDVLDAAIAALVARAAATGRCQAIPDGLEDRARREGWIALPSHGSLDELAASEPSTTTWPAIPAET